LLSLFLLAASILLTEFSPAMMFDSIYFILGYVAFLMLTVFIIIKFLRTHHILNSEIAGYSKEKHHLPEHHHHISDFWYESHKGTPFFVVIIIILLSLMLFSYLEIQEKKYYECDNLLCFSSYFSECSPASYKYPVYEINEYGVLNHTVTYRIGGISNRNCLIEYADNNYYLFSNMKGLKNADDPGLAATYQKRIRKYWENPSAFSSYHSYTCHVPRDYDVSFKGFGFSAALEYCK
jgi:hypothetical protein